MITPKMNEGVCPDVCSGCNFPERFNSFADDLFPTLKNDTFR